MMNKTKILTWLIAILLLMNVSIIGTILYHKYQPDQQRDSIAINSGTEGTMLNGKFFRQTLGFDNEQMNAFRNVNRLFRPEAMQLTFQIDSLKNEMFLELNKAEADTLQLNSQAKQIGALHGQLKYETYKFYLALKKVCTDQQKTALEKSFQPLFKNEVLTAQPNHQQQRRQISN